jgi:uncharacterized integral membrane protein
MKLIKLLPKLIILLLLIVLILNNMQKVEFNLYGVYIWHLPLIIILFITLIIGLIIGFTLRVIKLTELKLQVYNQKKEIENLKSAKNKL